MSTRRKRERLNPAHMGGDVMEYFRRREAENPEYASLVQDERDKLALAHRIRELREAKGLSQAEVAEQIGTKQPSIARIEHGESLPKIEMLQKLARVFGMRVQIEFVPAPRRRRRKAAKKKVEAREVARDEARPGVR
jgi:ribosome-binding protein aMBF1 (putative translation factor)